MVTRDDFCKHWLEERDCNSSYKKFEYFALKEIDHSRENIKPKLIEAIVDHMEQDRRVTQLLCRYGYEKTSEIIRKRLPKTHSTRMGVFGEIIASEDLRQNRGYEMPVFKLRYMDNNEMPMRGDDMLAFRINTNGQIAAICFGECKTQKDFNRSKVTKGYGQVTNNDRPLPQRLSLILTILYEKKETKLTNQIEEIIYKLKVIDYDRWLYIITGDIPTNPFKSIEDFDEVIGNFKAVSIVIDGLTDLMDNVFDNPVLTKDNKWRTMAKIQPLINYFRSRLTRS